MRITRILNFAIVSSAVGLVIACSGPQKKIQSEPEPPRKPSNDGCVFRSSPAKRTFPRGVSSNETNKWLAEMCRSESKKLAAQCSLGVPPEELKRTCTGSARPVLGNKSGPLLKDGPEKFSETKSFAEDGNTEAEADKKIQSLVAEKMAKSTERLNAFSLACKSSGGVPIVTVEVTEPPRSPETNETSNQFVAEAVMTTSASCHEKGNGNTQEFEAQVEMRFWR